MFDGHLTPSPAPLEPKAGFKAVFRRFPAALDKGGDPPTPPKQIRRWGLADAARRALVCAGVPSSIRACGMPATSGGSQVQLRKAVDRQGSDYLAVDGVSWCGSARCPRCAPLVSSRVSERVGTIVEAAKSKGFGIAFLTLTAAHTKETRLADARRDLGEAFRRLPDGGLVRRLKNGGFLGLIRTFEVTDGASGWHLHAHALVFHQGSAADAEASGRALIGRWIELMGSRGWRASAAAQDIRAIKKGDDIGDYVSKSLRGWDTAAELAGSWKKEGRRPGRVSIAGLLAMARLGDSHAGRRYAEAVEALKGQRVLTVGPALKKALGVPASDIEDEEEIRPEEAPGEIVGTLCRDVWKRAASVSRREWVLSTIWRYSVLGGVCWEDVNRLICEAFQPRKKPPDI